MRADVFLFKCGIAKSRSHAAALIASGVTINGVKIQKPSADIPPETEKSAIAVLSPTEYVGRGGIKLRHALKMFGINAHGLIAVDLGASTGGFTDCLLRSGAKKVYAVDVGHDQLDMSLRADSRVVNIEGKNARTLTKNDFPDKIDIVTSDLSFISQALVYGAVSDVLCDGGSFISLIKPQFEAGREALDKKGIVKKAEYRYRAVMRVLLCAFEAGFALYGITRSAIAGGDGNIEYLAYFKLADDKSRINTAAGGGYPFGMITPELENIISDII